MMELKCCENIDENKAYKDRTLLSSRVLTNLLKSEKYSFYDNNCDNYKGEVTPEMRTIVIRWMKDVTEEQQRQEEVFLLAVNYMNRFLASKTVRKTQLQLLGTCCIFIASKLREAYPLNAQLLRSYTDNSITLEELMMFEELVLYQLKWEVSVVTPLDFLQHTIEMIPMAGISRSMVDDHAKTLISYCMCEPTFWNCPPSVIAAACLISALHGVHWAEKSGKSYECLCEGVGELLGVEADCLSLWYKRVDDIVEREISRASGESAHQSYEHSDAEVARKNENVTPTPMAKMGIETATTPTDVHDVHLDYDGYL